MKEQSVGVTVHETLRTSANGSRQRPSSPETWNGLCISVVLGTIAALIGFSLPAAAVQDAAPRPSGDVAIQGRVLDSAGKPVAEASVRIQKEGGAKAFETTTNAAGSFQFSALEAGNYSLSAQKAGLKSRAVAVVAPIREMQKQIDLVLLEPGGGHADLSASSPPASAPMEFADEPAFTVAGVADWTAAGGHGSDSSLRTSEALTRETLTLKAESAKGNAAGLKADGVAASASESELRAAVAGAPASFEANRRLGDFYLQAGRHKEAIAPLGASYKIDPTNHDNEYELALALKEAGDFRQAGEHVKKLLAHWENADLHRLAGELDEQAGDPLAAVHEFEQAVRLDPSEQGYFEWGSELLLHRAIWQALEIFEKGAREYPDSARMSTALGAALFAGARYDEAALRLCAASDLNPADPEPYTFMGRIEMAAPNPLPCVPLKLARFAGQQPDNSLANYYYAMAIWKGQAQPPDPGALLQVERLLTKAVTIDPKCADATLQLGVLFYSQRDFKKAIGYYLKAIEANPELADAHYRLGLAYDRVGDLASAKREFQLHEQIKKRQAAEVERQRREVKQFVVIVPGRPTAPANR